MSDVISLKKKKKKKKSPFLHFLYPKYKTSPMYFDRNKERIAVIHLCFSIGERESVYVSEPE